MHLIGVVMSPFNANKLTTRNVYQWEWGYGPCTLEVKCLLSAGSELILHHSAYWEMSHSIWLVILTTVQPKNEYKFC